MNSIRNSWVGLGRSSNQLQSQDRPNYPYLLRPYSPPPSSVSSTTYHSATLPSNSEVSIITDRAERRRANSRVMADSAPTNSVPVSAPVSAAAGAEVKPPRACVCIGACPGCKAPRGVVNDENLPAHRVQQRIGSINPPIKDWPLYLLPFFYFLVNLAMLLFGYYALGFVRDITSEVEERLQVIYSFPKQIIISTMALACFGILIGITQFLVNPYSPWRRHNPHGILAGLYVVHFIWDCCEFSFLAGVVYRATDDFQGIQYLHGSLGVLAAIIVLFVVYAVWPGNPLTYQRTKNAPFGPHMSLTLVLDRVHDPPQAPQEPKTIHWDFTWVTRLVEKLFSPKKTSQAPDIEANQHAPPPQVLQSQGYELRDVQANQHAPRRQAHQSRNYDPDAIEPLPPLPSQVFSHPTRLAPHSTDQAAPVVIPRPLKDAKRGYFSAQKFDRGDSDE